MKSNEQSVVWKIGDKATCDNCNQQISFRGMEWMHDNLLRQLNQETRCFLFATPAQKPDHADLVARLEYVAHKTRKMQDSDWADEIKAVCELAVAALSTEMKAL